MSLIGEYKIYIIIGLVMLLLGGGVALYLLFGNKTATPQNSDINTTTISGEPVVGTKNESTNALSQKLNYPGSPQKEVTQEWVYYKTAKGAIKIKNIFPKNYSPDPQNSLTLVSTDKFKIQYVPNGDNFELLLSGDQDTEIESNKQAGEQRLLELFGASSNDVCQLPVFVYKEKTDNFRPNRYNLGLSFCPLN